MKKQVLTMIRRAHRAHDPAAAVVLAYIDHNGLESLPMLYRSSLREWTTFAWGALVVSYNGRTDRVTVRWGNCVWSAA